MALLVRVILALCGAAAAAPAVELFRSPYLQNMSADRVTIIWAAREQGLGAVRYSTDRSFSQRAVARMREFRPTETGQSLTYYEYRADLTALTPGVDYFYQVTVDGQLPTNPPEDTRFRTPGPGSFQFLAFGDSGQGTTEQQALAIRMATRESPDLVLHTGDIAYPAGTFSQFEDNYFAYYSPLMRRVPFFPSPGNHDYGDRPGPPTAYLAIHAVPFGDVPPRDQGRYYSFDWGNVHFISLDSNVPLMAAANGTGGMLEWLERDLQRTRQFWRVVYFHHPPYPTSDHTNDPNSKLVRDIVVPLLERYDVQLVLGGHEHNYQRRKSSLSGVIVPDGAGVVYIVTGGGGAALYAASNRPDLEASKSVHHYVRGEFQGPRLTLRAIDLNGTEIDSVSLQPKPRIDAIVNAASFIPALAPGSVVTIFGGQLAPEPNQFTRMPLPMDLSGTSVSLNGRMLPLFYVSPMQINTQLPFDTTGQAALRVRTSNGDKDVMVTINDAAPGIFGGSAFHANNASVTASEPAEGGEAVVLYLTGLGTVSGPIAAGEPAPVSPLLTTRAPVEVQIGSTSVSPFFAGLSPGSVGLYQVNVVLPANLPAGDYQIRVAARGASSNAVTLPVR
ncbi:MAG: metallophosphoesterase [Candidatus Solibacter usitatus]|nr:metallophosphoesterase [Candidatus Solibacter usitatus]